MSVIWPTIRGIFLLTLTVATLFFAAESGSMAWLAAAWIAAIGLIAHSVLYSRHWERKIRERQRELEERGKPWIE